MSAITFEIERQPSSSTRISKSSALSEPTFNDIASASSSSSKSTFAVTGATFVLYPPTLRAMRSASASSSRATSSGLTPSSFLAMRSASSSSLKSTVRTGALSSPFNASSFSAMRSTSASSSVFITDSLSTSISAKLSSSKSTAEAAISVEFILLSRCATLSAISSPSTLTVSGRLMCSITLDAI